MSRRRPAKHKYQLEDIKRVGKGRFRDMKTGRFVPKDFRKRIAARYYGAMNMKGRHEHAVSTVQFKYGLSEEDAKAAHKRSLLSSAKLALGLISSDEVEGTSDIAEEMAVHYGFSH